MTDAAEPRRISLAHGGGCRMSPGQLGDILPAPVFASDRSAALTALAAAIRSA